MRVAALRAKCFVHFSVGYNLNAVCTFSFIAGSFAQLQLNVG